MKADKIVFIGLGSNIGDRRANLEGAVRALEEQDRIDVLKVSEFHETEPVGGPPQGNFLNAVAKVKTQLAPETLLEKLQSIEKDFGRERSVRWGPRTLDLDILLYGSEVIKQPALQIPHPRMHERRFVLVPLCEISPEAYHPKLKLTAQQMLDQLCSS
ncbi:MAG: 2-amino-4-hydroxy-6-hydroxymethyldihydropteridine diphosphokinase [Candidatus Brocadiia bacterium]|nr:2-amino-4-hydroxy-6-hydroxymethyldihydropteridine diphosphokinase [Planctomycetota bacterium]